MSELERAGRLPVFVDEGQWARAYAAAKDTAELLFSQGLIDVADGASLATVATSIATAALRAAAEDSSGDIGDVPGIEIDDVGSHTATARHPSSRFVIRDRGL